MKRTIQFYSLVLLLLGGFGVMDMGQGKMSSSYLEGFNCGQWVQNGAVASEPPTPGRGVHFRLATNNTSSTKRQNFVLTKTVHPFQAGSIRSDFYSLKQLRCLFFITATTRRRDESVLRTPFRRLTSRIWRSQMNRRAVASSRLLKTIGRSPIQNGLKSEPIAPALKGSTFYVSSKFYLSVEFEIIKPT